MKTKLAALTLAAITALFAGTALTASARDVTLAWDAPPEANTLSGYKLAWRSVASPITTNVVDVPGAATLTTTATGLIPGKEYIFTAYSVGTNGLVSDPSNALSVTVPTGPQKLRLGLQINVSIP